MDIVVEEKKGKESHKENKKEEEPFVKAKEEDQPKIEVKKAEEEKKEDASAGDTHKKEDLKEKEVEEKKEHSDPTKDFDRPNINPVKPDENDHSSKDAPENLITEKAPHNLKENKPEEKHDIKTEDKHETKLEEKDEHKKEQHEDKAEHKQEHKENDHKNDKHPTAKPGAKKTPKEAGKVEAKKDIGAKADHKKDTKADKKEDAKKDTSKSDKKEDTKKDASKHDKKENSKIDKKETPKGGAHPTKKPELKEKAGKDTLAKPKLTPKGNDIKTQISPKGVDVGKGKDVKATNGKRPTSTKAAQSKTMAKKKSLHEGHSHGAQVLETPYETIWEYLTPEQTMNFVCMSKLSLTSFLKHQTLNSKIDKSDAENRLSILEKENSKEALNTATAAFTASSEALEKLTHIDESIVKSFVTENMEPEDEVLLTFKILFVLLGVQDLKDRFKSDVNFWIFVVNYVRDNMNEAEFGKYVSEEIKNFDFSEEALYMLYLLISKRERMIDPEYYENICPVSGYLMFLIKEVMQYAGLIGDKASVGQNYKIQKVLKDHAEQKLKYFEGYAEKFKIKVHTS